MDYSSQTYWWPLACFGGNQSAETHYQTDHENQIPIFPHKVFLPYKYFRTAMHTNINDILRVGGMGKHLQCSELAT